MSITPRKDEVAAVVALLESDQFDTSTSMASAIVKLVADILSLRTTRGVALGMPGSERPALALGPYYTLRDAKRAVTDAQEAGLQARMARLDGTGSIKAAQALKQVCVCGHRTEMHVFVNCAVTGCACLEVAYSE